MKLIDVEKSPGPTEDETAFYDALEVNDSAVELVRTVRNSVVTNWTGREDARA